MRHGETVGGACFRGSTDDPLSAQGWTQMRTAVDNEPEWNRIISSPLLRCADFAKSLNQQYGIPLKFDTRIKEIHFGVWEGKTAEELMQSDAEALKKYWQNPIQTTPPEAESLLNFKARVMSFWQQLIVDYRGEKILLITHGGVIRVLLCHVLQQPLQHLLELEVGHATIQRLCIEHTLQNNHATLIEGSV